MKYVNIHQKKLLPNRDLDKFLTQLHFLCKKHKICLVNPNGKDALQAVPFNPKNVKAMLNGIQDNLKTDEK